MKIPGVISIFSDTQGNYPQDLFERMDLEEIKKILETKAYESHSAATAQ